MNTPSLLALAAFAGAAAAANAASGDLDKLGWLAGWWESVSSAAAEPGSVEQWMPIAGGTMLGMSRTVRNGQTESFEFMQLRYLSDGTLAFIAQPSGRPATVFPLQQLSDTEAVFEDPTRDFPQRVAYARDGQTRLRARIEGLRNGTLRSIEFPMTRVGCDAPK
jgi:hypothetical protein